MEYRSDSQINLEAPCEWFWKAWLQPCRKPFAAASVFMILKMNFNFNFKDIPAPPNASIRRLTTA
jgi:hypothetical protein